MNLARGISSIANNLRKEALYHVVGIGTGLAAMLLVYMGAYQNPPAPVRLGTAELYQAFPTDQLGSLIRLAATKATTRNADLVPVFRTAGVCSTKDVAEQATLVKAAILLDNGDETNVLTILSPARPLHEFCRDMTTNANSLFAVADVESLGKLQAAGNQPSFYGATIR